MKILTAFLVLSIVGMILLRGTFHVIKIPFQSIHCEAD